MSIAQNWVHIGNISLVLNQPVDRQDLQATLRQLKPYDMLSVRVQHPELYPVAVDTGQRPYTMQQAGRDYVELAAQIIEIHFFEKVIQMHCQCYDQSNDLWFTAQLSIGQQRPHWSSIQLKSSAPINDFGAPAPKMEQAFQRLYQKLHASRPLLT